MWRRTHRRAALATAAAAVSFVLFAEDAEATIYKWRDKRGAIHITDDWNDIPQYARLELAKKRPGLTVPERAGSSVRASARRIDEKRRPGAEREAASGPRRVEAAARAHELSPSRVVVLDADGIRVPPGAKENRAFWEDLIRSWRKQLGDATEGLESARKEEQIRARIRQYIPLKIHTDAMLEAQAKAAKLEVRIKQVRRVLDETIPRLAREAGANLSWLK